MKVLQSEGAKPMGPGVEVRLPATVSRRMHSLYLVLLHALLLLSNNKMNFTLNLSD